MRGGRKECCGRKAWALAWAAFYVLAVTAPAGAQKPVMTPEQPAQVDKVAGTVVSMDPATRTLVLQPAQTQRPITLTWEKDKDAFMRTVANQLKRGTGVRVLYKKAGGKVQDISIVKTVDKSSSTTMK